MGEALKTEPKATGTRGQGRPCLGGSKSEPPEQDEPTLAEKGVAKKRSIERVDEIAAELKAEHKAAELLAHPAAGR